MLHWQNCLWHSCPCRPVLGQRLSIGHDVHLSHFSTHNSAVPMYRLIVCPAINRMGHEHYCVSGSEATHLFKCSPILEVIVWNSGGKNSGNQTYIHYARYLRKTFSGDTIKTFSGDTITSYTANIFPCNNLNVF